MARITETYNLEAQYPAVAAEWHPDNPCRPHQVTPYSNRRFLWEHTPDGHPHCPSHVWEALVFSRVSGKGCPFCAGRRACASNNLEVLRPDLAAEWHPDNPCGPDTVTIGSDRRVKWSHSLVVDGQLVRHEWEARVTDRTGGSDCAVCMPAGFRDDRPGAVYLLYHPVAQLVKVGITNCDPQGRNSHRFAYFASRGWELVRLWHHPHGLRVRRLEAAVHALLADRGGVYLTDRSAMPGETDGWTETIRVASVGATADVEQLISQLAENYLGDEAALPEAA